ncbi:MAG: CDP-alcohol phosphatidyltransferase family protein [bacterium]
MTNNKLSFINMLRYERVCTLSNMLTFVRIALSPIVMFGIFKKWWVLAFSVFIVASLTDLLDGYLARRLNEQTKLGTMLDPIADKIFLVSCFSALAFFSSPSFFIPTWFVAMVVGREVIILVGSSILMFSGVNFEVKPTIWGKLTTFFQLLFICWIFICYFLCWVPMRTYGVFLVLLAVFSLLSLLQYIKIWLNYVSNLKREKNS